MNSFDNLCSEKHMLHRLGSVSVADLTFGIECSPCLIDGVSSVVNHYFCNFLSAPQLHDDRTIKVCVVAQERMLLAIQELAEVRGCTQIRSYFSNLVKCVVVKGESIFFSDDTQFPRIYFKRGREVYAFCAEIGASREILRLIREVSTRMHESRGGISIHGASVEVKDAGVMLVGPSGSGKTTIAINLMAGLGAKVICNDRSLVNLNDSGTLKVFASPVAFRISAGTLKSSAKLRKLVFSGETERKNEISEAHLSGGHIAFDQGGREIKAELTPLELANLFTVPRVHHATLKLGIIPTFEPSIRVPVIENLSHSQIHSAIQLENRTISDPIWPSPWIEPRKEVTMNCINKLLETKFVSIKFGTDTTALQIALNNLIQSGLP
jgi:energy-coupling factor transporter ATP-binding protein EcfA2